MKRFIIAALGIVLVVWLSGFRAPSIRAQPVATIALPAPGSAKQLYSGCNNISLTFPDGTPSQTVVQAVSATGAIEAMWRYNVILNKFEGFSPTYPQASDLLTVNFLDAVWLCMALPGPSPTPTQAPTQATQTPMTSSSQLIWSWSQAVSGPAGAVVIVEFRQGMVVRLTPDGLVSLGLEDVSSAADVFARYPIVEVAPDFSRPVEELERERRRLEQETGTLQPDLTLFFRVTLAAGADASAFVQELLPLDTVQTAYVQPEPAPPPAGPVP
jgi:hypothetical protein